MSPLRPRRGPDWFLFPVIDSFPPSSPPLKGFQQMFLLLALQIYSEATDQELAGTRKGWLKEGCSHLRELPCLSASLPLSLTLGGCGHRLKCTVIHSPSLFNAQGNGLRPSTGVNTFMQAIISFKTFTAFLQPPLCPLLLQAQGRKKSHFLMRIAVSFRQRSPGWAAPGLRAGAAFSWPSILPP